MAIDIIYNGSFSNYAYWDWYNVDCKRENVGCTIKTTESFTVTDTVPPGIYQVLELADYKKKLSLDINFRAKYLFEGTPTDRLYFSVYIYEITEYTKFATGEIWTYELPTKYTDYKYKYNCTIYPEYANSWRDFNTNVILEPGYYIIGFTANVFKSAENEGSNEYARYISDPLNALTLNNISANLIEIDEVDFHNVLINGSFESINAPFDKWIGKEVTTSDVFNDNNAQPCPEDLGKYCKRVNLNSGLDYNKRDDYCYGLNQIVEVDCNCMAEVSFWHRVDSTSTAYLYVYNLSSYYEDTNTFYINSIVCDEIFFTYDSWRYFHAFFPVEKNNTYMISIVPPEDTMNGANFYVDKVSFNLFTSNLGNNDHDGSFEKPYNEEDGVIFYSSANRIGFEFYDGSHPGKYSYIRMSNGEYYMVQLSNGEFFANDMFLIDDELYEPGTCQKYFFPDGSMAIDEQFVWNDAIWTANYRGKVTGGSSKVFGINTNINNAIDMLPDEEITIHASFNDQNPPIALTVTSSDNSVAIITGINPNIAYEGTDRAMNSSNTITVLGKSYGKTTITISYQNFDGTVPTAKIDVYIRDPIEYENMDNITITMLYPVNYVALNSVLDLKCLVTPVMSSEIPIDWISSDRTIAKVNSSGQVTPIALGTCTITAKNYNTDKSDVCVLYVVEQTVEPVLIKTSVESLNLNLGERVRVTAEAYSSKGSMNYVTQEVVWSTSNDKVATVDEYGFVKGINKGTAIITCCCAKNYNIKKDITVNVSGISTALTNINLNMYETMLNYDDPKSHEYLIPTFVPAETKETDVVWSSSNKDVVTVASNGRIAPTYENVTDEPVIITCTSATNPFIYRTCKVSVVMNSQYYPTVVLSTDELKTYIGATARLDYSVSYYYNSMKDAIVKITKKDGSATRNTLTVTSSYILLNPVETGEFVITVSCTHGNNTTIKTCSVNVYDSDEAPEYIKDLEVLYSLQNGTYVLRYYAEDAIDDTLGHVITIDNIDRNISPSLYQYNGQKYYYYFGSDLTAGEHNIYITVNDSQDIVTGNSFAQSNTVRVTRPLVVNKKTSLNDAKVSYDIVKNDALNYLYEMMNDRFLYDDEKLEFQIRYQLFCVLYDNLVDILETCIEHINSQIEVSQAELDTIATALSGNGVSTASYSEGDYTTSNYQNVNDLDYYQSICIKALAQKVFELEARLNELTNNNN